jgi:tRNA pseudouridine55 synthase
MDGALNIDKPAGMTSHDVVARVRRIVRERSVGHLGTLDPMATGVLPLLLGRLTRLAQFFQSRDKEYEGEIVFGYATNTYDAAGEPVGPVADRLPTRDEVEAVLPRFRGAIMQAPPAYSAKKVAGERAYRIARREETIELPAVPVEIHAFEVFGMRGPSLDFRVRCSTGTYVRALAHDLGAALGAGAHLGALRRTRVGEFALADAVSLDTLQQAADAGQLARHVVGPMQLLPEMPAVIAPPEAAAKVLQGRAVNLAEFSRSRQVRIFSPDMALIAIGSRIAGSLFQPRIVFPQT